MNSIQIRIEKMDKDSQNKYTDKKTDENNDNEKGDDLQRVGKMYLKFPSWFGNLSLQTQEFLKKKIYTVIEENSHCFI